MIALLLMVICIIEGDSLTATASYNIDANVRIAYPWVAAGFTPPQVPGSSTFGSNSPQSFQFQVGNVLCINRAIGGSRILTNGPIGSYPGDLVQRSSTWIDALVNTSYPDTSKSPLSVWESTRPTRKYILSVLIGTNQDTSNPTTHCNNLKTYLESRLTAFNGFLKGLIIGTLISHNGGSDEASFETYRQGVNTILRTWGPSTFTGSPAFALADFGADPVIGAPGACDDLTLVVDGTHPSALGYSYMTPIWTAALNAVVATL